MSLDNSKTIQSVTYNGADWPIGGSGGGGSYNISTLDKQDGTQELYITDASGGVNLQIKRFTVTESGEFEITPDAGFDGMTKVLLNVVLAEARIGSVYYSTLASAISAATAGQTIEVLGDVHPSAAYETNKQLTIDFGGHTVVIPDGLNLFTCNGNTLTIQNGTIYSSYDPATAVYSTASSAVIKLYNVTVQCKNTFSIAGNSRCEAYGCNIRSTYLYWTDGASGNYLYISGSTIASQTVYPGAAPLPAGHLVIT